MQIAVVATARKLAVLCWHMITRDQDYAFARPSLTAKKLRALQLKAGLPARRGQKGSAAGYSLRDVRAREKALAEQAEQAYRQMVADQDVAHAALLELGQHLHPELAPSVSPNQSPSTSRSPSTVSPSAR